jgi:hypothetical protein
VQPSLGFCLQVEELERYSHFSLPKKFSKIWVVLVFALLNFARVGVSNWNIGTVQPFYLPESKPIIFSFSIWAKKPVVNFSSWELERYSPFQEEILSKRYSSYFRRSCILVSVQRSQGRIRFKLQIGTVLSFRVSLVWALLNKDKSYRW